MGVTVALADCVELAVADPCLTHDERAAVSRMYGEPEKRAMMHERMYSWISIVFLEHMDVKLERNCPRKHGSWERVAMGHWVKAATTNLHPDFSKKREPWE